VIAGLAHDLGIGEAELETQLAAVRARWPEAPVPDADFAAYLLERKPPAIGNLRIDDLFLAWWCSNGDSRAIAAFDAAHAVVLERLLHRFHRLDADELRQRLHVKLFVGDRARIREYSGLGLLENWFKVIAARTFLDAARATARERTDPLPDELDVAGSMEDARKIAQRAQVVAAVKRALDTAISGLPPRERTYLRHVIVDGLTQDQIASTYSVHRVTVARTLASAREQLHDVTRGLVVAELGTSNIASTLALLDSQLDLSLQRLFPEPTL
jgi:RNA polymerase sigma-70 factor (ECF subfamily)